jgi:transcriptional regulator with XRE-family HTH domain
VIGLEVLRVHLRFSRRQLALAARISPTTVGWICAGRLVPSEAQLAKLVAVVEYPLERIGELLADCNDVQAEFVRVTRDAYAAQRALKRWEETLAAAKPVES